MKKYRAGKIKREHSVIEHLWPALEQIAASDLVTSVIPGPISPLSGRGFEITFQRFTETGLRLLAKNGSAIQEVWVVATNPQAALEWLAREGIVKWSPEPKKEQRSPGKQPQPLTMVTLPSDMVCAICGRPMLAGSRVVRLGQRNYSYVHKRCAR